MSNKLNDAYRELNRLLAETEEQLLVYPIRAAWFCYQKADKTGDLWSPALLFGVIKIRGKRRLAWATVQPGVDVPEEFEHDAFGVPVIPAKCCKPLVEAPIEARLSFPQHLQQLQEELLSVTETMTERIGEAVNCLAVERQFLKGSA